MISVKNCRKFQKSKNMASEKGKGSVTESHLQMTMFTDVNTFRDH
jgi:hypothetical protein